MGQRRRSRFLYPTYFNHLDFSLITSPKGAGRVQREGLRELGHAVRVQGVLGVHVRDPGRVEPVIHLGHLREDRELLQEEGQAPARGA